MRRRCRLREIAAPAPRRPCRYEVHPGPEVRRQGISRVVPLDPLHPGQHLLVVPRAEGLPRRAPCGARRPRGALPPPASVVVRAPAGQDAGHEQAEHEEGKSSGRRRQVAGRAGASSIGSREARSLAILPVGAGRERDATTCARDTPAMTTTRRRHPAVPPPRPPRGLCVRRGREARRRAARAGHRADRLRRGRPDRADARSRARAPEDGRRRARDLGLSLLPGRSGLPRGVRATGWSGASACDLDPDREVCATIGTKEAVFNVHEGFLDPGDVVLVPSPGYPPYKRGAPSPRASPGSTRSDARTASCPTSTRSPTEVAERARAIWVCYPNSPTGRRRRPGLLRAADGAARSLRLGRPLGRGLLRDLLHETSRPRRSSKSGRKECSSSSRCRSAAP